MGLDGARQILVQDGNPFAAVALDPTGDLGIDFGLSGVPESFLIDAQGQIIKTKRNYFIEEDARDFIAAYRAEKAKQAPGAGG
jgi:cytochrome c biogenesis protein CcmG/thiol:disulfide interchange protein DsbE